jgi:hypothetical protein
MFRNVATAAFPYITRTIGANRDGLVGCGWVGEPFPLIVKRADAVVQGTVLAKRAHATLDDRDIFTAFQVAPDQVILQRVRRCEG